VSNHNICHRAAVTSGGVIRRYLAEIRHRADNTIQGTWLSRHLSPQWQATGFCVFVRRNFANSVSVKSAVEAWTHCDKGITLCRWISSQNLSNPERLSYGKKDYKVYIPRRVQRLYQGVICFQEVVRFHGTRIKVTCFAPVRKVRPSVRQLWRNSQMLTSVMCRPLARSFTQIGNKCGKYCYKIIYASKHVFHGANSHKNDDHPTNVCEHPLYRIMYIAHEKWRE
jgi:hypothetical protein